MAMVKEGNAKKGNRRNDPSSSKPSHQNQMDATPYDKEFEISPTCRICGLADETISHIVSECTPLAQKDYKNVRHDRLLLQYTETYVRSMDLSMRKKAITTTLTRKAEHWRMMK